MRINKKLQEVGDYCIIDYGLLHNKPLSELTDIIGINSHVKLYQEYTISKDGKNWDTWSPCNYGWLNNLVINYYTRIKYTVTANLLQEPIIVQSYEILQETPQTTFVSQQESILLSRTNNVPDMQRMSHQMVQLESDLNYYLNQASSIIVDYWHTNPNLNSQDTFLKEYSLHNVVSHKPLRCVVKDNQVPEPRHEFSQWGIEFEKLEVYFEKIYFEEIFGIDAKPRANDYIYFHELNRMYYISDCYLQHGIAERGTYYICSIKKFENNTAVEKEESDLDFLKNNLRIDDYSEEDYEEMIDMTNDQQNMEKETIVDVVRQYTDVGLKPVHDVLYNNGNDVSMYYYPMNFKTVDQSNVAVRYNSTITLTEHSGTSIMFWIKVDSIDSTFKLLKLHDKSNNIEFIVEYSNRKLYLRPNLLSTLEFSLPVKLIPEEWTCVVLSINNEFNYWSVYSYVRRPQTDKTTALQCITKREAKLTYTDESSQLNKSKFCITLDQATIELLTGDYSIRMIRISNLTVSSEYHSYVMGSKNVSKPSQFLVIDDCEPNLRHYNVGESLFPKVNDSRDKL